MVGLTLAGISMMPLQFGYSQERSLLDHATRIISTAGIDQVSYLWLSDHTLLVYNQRPDPILLQVDTVSGAKTPLITLKKRLLRINSTFPLLFYRSISVSPNGRWLLLTGEEGQPNVIASPDGTTVLKREAAEEVTTNGIWLPGSRSWIQLEGDSGEPDALIESRDTSSPIHKALVAETDKVRLLPYIVRLLGSTSTGHILGIRNDFYTDPDNPRRISPGTDRKIGFFEFSIKGTQVDVRPYTITLPKGGGLYSGKYQHFNYDGNLGPGEDIALSPDGRHLGWIVYVKYDSTPRSLIEVRTSRLDGSEVHIIRKMEFNPGPAPYGGLPHPASPGPRPPWPLSLQWTPDGKRLSFIYKDILWSVPVE
ncbi:MAG TPA: hypothetical protein VKT32_13370 [Chthonomonadaceae bacterium]|nr:hypothetical protein [Chthonomonadaceae bacterium]